MFLVQMIDSVLTTRVARVRSDTQQIQLLPVSILHNCPSERIRRGAEL